MKRLPSLQTSEISGYTNNDLQRVTNSKASNMTDIRFCRFLQTSKNIIQGFK